MNLDVTPRVTPPSALPMRLDWIVSLRGVAALSVFAYHLWIYLGKPDWAVAPWGLRMHFGRLVGAGSQGVELFFVLSGFVIAWPYIVGAHTRLVRADIVDFYQRRFLRIAPVYYVSIGVALAVAAAGFARPVDPYVVALHVLFAENFDPNAVAAINAVYWTLPTEMHYYLVFPLLLRWAPVERPLLIASIGLVVALTYRWFTLWSDAHGVWLSWTAAYLPGRIDQFAAGFAAACGVVRAQGRGYAGSRRALLIAAACAIAVAIVTHRDSAFGWRYLFGPSLSAIAFASALYFFGVYFVGNTHRTRSRGVVAKLVYLVGLASLSVYLWHTPFLDLVSQVARGGGLSRPAQVAAIVASVPVVLGFSWLTYYFIERPFIEFSKSNRWRARLAEVVGRRRRATTATGAPPARAPGE